MVHHAENMTWEELRRVSGAGGTAVLPTGSLEQHGPHLPTKVDTLLVDRVTAAAADKASGVELVLLPTLWLGASDHHTPFFAASVTELTYIQMIADLAESVARAEFARLIIVNGHGGNSAPLRVALSEIRRRAPGLTAVAAEYWALAAEAIRTLRTTEKGGMAHAGELETSLVLSLSPESVRTDALRSALPDAPDSLIPDLVNGGAAASSAQWSRFATDGAIGDPRKAGAEAGKAYFDKIVAAVADFLVEAAGFSGSDSPASDAGARGSNSSRDH